MLVLFFSIYAATSMNSQRCFQETENFYKITEEISTCSSKNSFKHVSAHVGAS